jgi:hypothetical protein
MNYWTHFLDSTPNIRELKHRRFSRQQQYDSTRKPGNQYPVPPEFQNIKQKLIHAAPTADIMSSFPEIREVCLVLFEEGVLTEEQFILLYLAYDSRNPEFPYSNY